MDIEKALQELKEAREQGANAKAQMDEMTKAVTTSKEYLALQQYRTAADLLIESLTKAITDEADKFYKSTAEKKFHDKVQVKIFAVAKILDANKVREWCFKNLPAALHPDLKTVEKYAKDFGNVDGVEVVEEPRVQIATKL